MQIERIIPQNLFNKLKLESFQVALIPGKFTNKVIQILKGLNTLPEDTYFLKRVRKNNSNATKLQAKQNQVPILEVLLCLSEDKEEFMQNIQEKFFEEFKENVIIAINTVSLPRHAPISKKDFHLWSQYWPCTYLEPDFVKSVHHQKDELQLIGEIHDSLLHQESSNQQSLILFSEKKYLFRQEGSSLVENCSSRNPLSHSMMVLAQKWPNSQRFKQKDNEFYYFTGLRIMIKSSKICGMCAMALVHSRVQRIYFEEESIPPETILEILHSTKLNHRINLFKIIKNKQ